MFSFSLLTNPFFLSIIGTLVLVFVIFLTFKIKKGMCINKIKNIDKILDNENNATVQMYLVKIKAICKSNFEYQPIYNELKAKADLLFVTKNEAFKKRKVTLLKQIKSGKSRKNTKENIQTFFNEINLYEKEVHSLIESCEDILKQESDLRKRSTKIKSLFQELHDTIDNYAENLTIIMSTLQNYVNDMEMEFDLYESAMNNANYQDATNRLNSIENKLNRIYGKIEDYAKKCNIVGKVIPEKVEKLVQKNDDLLKKNYYVMHLRIKDLAAIIHNRLEKICSNFKSLNFEGFEEDIIEIEEKINEFSLALDEEIASKINFDSHSQEVLNKAKKLEQDFIKIKRTYSSALEYYAFDEELKKRFDSFQVRATKLSDQKREFESYIFVNARNPYSFMIKKMKDLDELSAFVNSEIRYFEQIMQDYKDCVEDIHGKITKLCKNIIVCKGYARKNKMNNILLKNESDLNQYIHDLENIIHMLYQKPICVSKIKNTFLPLKQKIEELCIDITNNVNDALLATKAMLFANQIRDQFQELDQKLEQAEMLYNMEDYQKCAMMVVDLLKIHHPSAYNILGDK